MEIKTQLNFRYRLIYTVRKKNRSWPNKKLNKKQAGQKQVGVARRHSNRKSYMRRRVENESFSCKIDIQRMFTIKQICLMLRSLWTVDSPQAIDDSLHRMYHQIERLPLLDGSQTSDSVQHCASIPALPGLGGYQRGGAGQWTAGRHITHRSTRAAQSQSRADHGTCLCPDHRPRS